MTEALAKAGKLLEESEALLLQSVRDDALVIARRMLLIKMAVEYALKVQHPQMWTCHEGRGGKPDLFALNSHGAAAVGGYMGVVQEMMPQFEWEDLEHPEDGPYRICTCSVMVSFHGTRLTEMGTSSTRDPFWARRKDKQTQEAYYLPLEMIDQTNVKKKAATNALGRAVKKLFGIPSFTEKQLREARIDTKAIREGGTISYGAEKPGRARGKPGPARAGGKGGTAKPPRREPPASTGQDVELEGMRDELRQRILKLTGDEADARTWLKEVTGKERPGALTRAEVTHVFGVLDELTPAEGIEEGGGDGGGEQQGTDAGGGRGDEGGA